MGADKKRGPERRSASKDQIKTGEIMTFVQRALRGEERLWRVWWIGGSVSAIAIYVWTRFVVVSLALSSSDEGTRNAAAALLFIGLTASLGSALAQWRCAFNVSWHGWGWIARTWILASLLLNLFLSWYVIEMIRGKVSPEYGPIAAALWKGPIDNPPTTPAVSLPTLNTPPTARYLDPNWQLVTQAAQPTDPIQAAYAGLSEQATIGRTQWLGSLKEFGGRSAANASGWETVGKPGESTADGNPVWATYLKGVQNGVPYYAVYYAIRTRADIVSWVWVVSSYPVSASFGDRSWALAQAVSTGEYPR
ncbi:hypothetical protein [Paraburkholderia sp. D1E]|uniref:hypothetical protein n=1 Tax=Paraburkholderia sp. D1E TaxID=3461398 RepID=UPI0040452D2F